MRNWARMKVAVVTTVAATVGLVTAAGAMPAAHATTSEPETMWINTTQEGPLAGEPFTLSVDADELADLKAREGSGLTYSWRHTGDCTLLTAVTGETLTASCPNPNGRIRLDREFGVDLFAGGQLVGQGRRTIKVTVSRLTLEKAIGISKLSRFYGNLEQRVWGFPSGYPDAPVQIQRRPAGSTVWKTIFTVRTTGPDGWFDGSHEVRQAGLVRARFAGDDTLQPLTSKAVWLKLATNLTMRRQGSVITLTLTDAWGKALAGQHVYISNGNGFLAEETYTKTNRYGKARIVVNYRGSRELRGYSQATRNYWDASTKPFRMS